jgi:hypothetical protein
VVKAKKPEVIHDRRAELPAIQAAGTVVAMVRDPYSAVGENITVLRATRDDPLAGMLARGQIDLAQYEAGREWQRHWEDAAIGAVRAIDPTKEPVDGKGPMHSPFTERQRKAMVKLREVALVLGYEGDRLIRDILGERTALALAAERRHWAKKYLGRRFRECLETMAKLMCFA